MTNDRTVLHWQYPNTLKCTWVDEEDLTLPTLSVNVTDADALIAYFLVSHWKLFRCLLQLVCCSKFWTVHSSWIHNSHWIPSWEQVSSLLKLALELFKSKYEVDLLRRTNHLKTRSERKEFIKKMMNNIIRTFLWWTICLLSVIGRCGRFPLYHQKSCGSLYKIYCWWNFHFLINSTSFRILYNLVSRVSVI